MLTPWTNYIVILILNALACVMIALLLWRKQFAIGKTAMTLLFIALAFWIFGYAMLLTATSLDWKIFWLRIENIGIIPQSLFWFLFALQYSTQSNKTPKWLIAVLSILPVVSLFVIFSDNLIHLYYPTIERAYPNGGPLQLSRAPLYWVMFAQIYLLLLASLGLLLRRFITHRSVYRKQMGLLITATLFPWVANIYFQLAPRLPLPAWMKTDLDVTPLTFAISAVLISGAVFGLKLFDLVPVARHRVLEHIPQMVVVLDNQNRVLDINDIGQKWIGKSAEEMIGCFAADVFGRWSEIILRYYNKTLAHEEVKLAGNSPRTFEIDLFPIYNLSKLEGKVFVAHDITSRINLEEDLKRANLLLKSQLAEIQSLREKLEQQAIRDPLTGMYNRRFLAEALEDEIARAKKTSTPVSIIILDVDNFKNFNDTYGHKCGDFMLQALVKILAAESRRGDIVCRYGGEEFAILMPNATLESAYERAEQWRKEFAAMKVEFEGQLLSTTFSAGVACFPIHGQTGEVILQASDRAMYQSKNKGKNLVTAYMG